tara:strand:+ start:1438 stop:3063 length:1626 start_codon:yes stop_codon:yes gene_type:complete
MFSKLKHFKRDFNQWSLLTVTIALFVAIPLFSILFNLFSGVGNMWKHIVSHYLFDYVVNSILLILGTGLLTFFFGTGCAWFVAKYEFPFRKWIEKFLFLPLAIPSYILAYTYIGLFDNGGTIVRGLQAIGIPIQKLDFMNIYGLIVVLSFSLFPYVYASARVLFLSLPKSIYESSMLLGASNKRYFFSVALPLATPAIIGGLFLVFMEVLNDYGAAKYYGINTFTTGIFRSWTMLEDLQSAVYLSALLVVMVFLIVGIVAWQRGRKSYAVKGNNTVENNFERKTLKGNMRFFCFFILGTPLLLGLIFPVFQLIVWAFQTFDEMFNIDLLWTALQSLLVALVASFFTLTTALALIYFSKWNYLKKINIFRRIGTIGYVIPGAIIGIGIIKSSQSVIDFFSEYLNLSVGYLFYGSSIVLIYAYVFRFLSVTYNPLEANSLKMGKHLSESSYLLGIGKLKTLLKIDLPLIKNALISSFLLVFIDVMKELPLTLILKPYNLKTLAISAYAYAEDEMVAEAALPSLVLIFIVMALMFSLKIDKRNG